MGVTSVVRPLTATSPVQASVLQDILNQINELSQSVKLAMDLPNEEVGSRYLVLLGEILSRAKVILEDILLGTMEWGLVGWRLRGAYAGQRLTLDNMEQSAYAPKRMASHAQKFHSAIAKPEGDAQDPADERALARGACALVTMLASRKTRMARLEVLARACHDQLREHISLMRECVCPLGEDPSSRESRLEQDFEALLSRKYELYGRAPKLVLVHDVDFNLVRQDDGFDQFPMWELFWRQNGLTTDTISPLGKLAFRLLVPLLSSMNKDETFLRLLSGVPGTGCVGSCFTTRLSCSIMFDATRTSQTM